MEKVMSTQDKIRKAEEIYNRRRENQSRVYTTKVNINGKKDIKLFKKMFIQIIVCLAIYSGFYLIKNNNYIFSEDFLNMTKDILSYDFLNMTKDILSYDVNFKEMYLKSIELIQNQNIIIQEEKDTQENTVDSTEENAIGGAEDNKDNVEPQKDKELSQMEQDAMEIKKSISFINPINGTITSKFGWREPSSSSVPKNHKGLDIANISGTVIRSATDGYVVLASSEGDYRQSFKNTD